MVSVRNKWEGLMVGNNLTKDIPVASLIKDAKISRKMSMKEIVGRIRSDEFKSIADDIQKHIQVGENKRVKSEKINNLPAFFPTVDLNYSTAFSEQSFVQPTGIIQFDLDDVPDVDDLKSGLLLVPEVIYMFTSPSGGIKFGVATDFKCSNYDVVKDEYAQAYELVKEYINSQVKINADDAVRSINQACWFSWDPDAYYNESPSVYLVAESATLARIKKDIEDENKRQSELFLAEDQSIDRDEAERALSYIPKTLPYHDRFRINLSVISIFGVDAEAILLGHWNHDEPAKLRNQIRDQFSKYDSYRQGIITAGTLFHEARKNGYKSTKNNRRSTHTDKSPTFNEVSYPKEESEAKLKEKIGEFFDSKKSLLINYEAGAGKTQSSIQAVFDKIKTNPNIKVAVFVQSHEIAEQYKNDFAELYLKEYKSEESDFKAKLISHSARRISRQRVQHIRGRSFDGMCGHDLIALARDADDEGEKRRLEKLYNENTGALCLHCPYSVNCEYINQFNNDLAQVRIYTHSQLFNMSSLWDSGSEDDGVFVTVREGEEWTPDYIIVDEDVVSLALHGDHVEKVSYSFAPAVLQNVIHEMKSKPLVEVVKAHGDQLEREAEDQKAAYREWKRKNFIDFSEPLDEIINSYSGYNAPKQYRVLDALSDLSLFIKDSISEGKSLDSLQHTGIWLSEAGDALLFAEKALINDTFNDRPILLLDASANDVVVKAAFGEKFEIETIRVDYQDNVKVFQYENTLYTKRQLSDNVKVQERVKQKITELSKGKKFGIITYQHLDSQRNFAQCLAKDLGAEMYGYFGALRGLNKFEELDQLFIVGRHSIGFGLKTLCRQLFGGISLDGDEFNLEPDYCVKNVYRMKDGGNMEIDSFGYPDGRMAALDKHFNRAETYQAVHRLRLIHGERDKEVHILTNEVLDVSIDELHRLDKAKVKTDDRIELIRRVIKEKGELENKKSVIVDATGLPPEVVANLRRGDFKARLLKGSEIITYEEREESTPSGRIRKAGYFVCNAVAG